MRKNFKKICDIDLSIPIKKGIRKVQDTAKILVAVDLGDLRNSIDTKISKNQNEVIGEVFTNNDHAAYIEFGTGPKGTGTYPFKIKGITLKYVNYNWIYFSEKLKHFVYTKGQIAKPYMYPALKTNKKQIIKYIADYYKQEIRKLGIK
ncbi:MAG: HK97 gp10 family phage protein [Bacilli bacterium]|nr:HK97 gp10 family phage protein [Bacilli bacterium]